MLDQRGTLNWLNSRANNFPSNNILRIFLLLKSVFVVLNRLYGLVVRVPGYRSRGPGFDSRCYQVFWEVVGLELVPLSLVKINKELLERKVAAPVYKTEINGRGESLRWPRDTLYPLKLALTSPRRGGRSVGIVRWRTKATEFFRGLKRMEIVRYKIYIVYNKQ
jgi:hypothetical protein